MDPKIEMAGQSDVGQERDSNQDQFLVAEVRQSLDICASSLDSKRHDRLFSGSVGQLAVVADGMGGHTGGETASAIAIHVLESVVLNALPWCFRHHGEESDDFAQELKKALTLCQVKIDQAVDERPELKGMGTTVTMAYLIWPKLYVVHAGDSRCYVKRGALLKQVTTDHTIAMKLVEDGFLESDEVQNSPYNHVLWNAVGGGDEPVRPQIVRLTLKPGDQVLLCSDGLTGHVADKKINNALSHDRSAADVCEDMVEQANQGGGEDNITVVVMRIHDDEGEQSQRKPSSIESQTLKLNWEEINKDDEA